MVRSKRCGFASIAITALLLSMAACELFTDFDRGLLPPDEAGSSTLPPPEADNDGGDGGDASDAEGGDAADAADAADESDATDASLDAADAADTADGD
jgi:hypothetical protein